MVPTIAQDAQLVSRDPSAARQDPAGTRLCSNACWPGSPGNISPWPRSPALLTAGSLAVVLRIVLALPHDHFEVDGITSRRVDGGSCRAQRRRDPAHRRRHRAVLPRGPRPGRAHRAGRHFPGRFSTSAAAGARAGAPAWRAASAQPPARPLRSPATTTAATVGSAQRPKVGGQRLHVGVGQLECRHVSARSLLGWVPQPASQVCRLVFLAHVREIGPDGRTELSDEMDSRSIRSS